MGGPDDAARSGTGCDRLARDWVAAHGGSFFFLIAAHMTFSRVFDDFFDDPAEDSERLVHTAGRRLSDAAAVLDGSAPVPDQATESLLRNVLVRVRHTVAVATDTGRSVEVIHLKARTDDDLVELAERLRVAS